MVNHKKGGRVSTVGKDIRIDRGRGNHKQATSREGKCQPQSVRSDSSYLPVRYGESVTQGLFRAPRFGSSTATTQRKGPLRTNGGPAQARGGGVESSQGDAGYCKVCSRLSRRWSIARGSRGSLDGGLHPGFRVLGIR